MMLNNSHQNQLNFNKVTESVYTCTNSDDNFKNNRSEVHNLNNSGYKNDIKHNGEVENPLSQKTEQTQDRKHFGTRKNNRNNTNNEFVRPAGLSSDRCTRDFMSAKNRKYHWNQTKMDDNYFNQKVYRGSNSEGDYESERNLIDKENNYRSDNNTPANYIYKSNQMLRNENRLRNTRHSDIFGTSNERNFKRTISSESKTYSDNISNNSLDNELKLSNNSTDNVSTYSLNSKDNDFRYGYNVKDDDSVYSNKSLDYDYGERMERRSKVKKEDLLDVYQIGERQREYKVKNSNDNMNNNSNNGNITNTNNKDDYYNNTRNNKGNNDNNYNNNRDNDELDLLENRSKYKDRLTRIDKEDKEDKETESVDLKEDKLDRQKLLGVVCLKLSGLKSETCEKDLETLCRCCKLQILSINLDRNIITHSCTGTAKLKLKDPGQDNLVNLQDLLRLQGFKCKL